jgi:mono/diheme cytochrome c family protein
MNDTRRTLLAALAGVVVLALLRLLFGVDPDRRGLEFLPDMAHSPAARSFAASDLFRDGAVEQPLVAGVVPRGHLPFAYPATPEGAAQAGKELKNPFAAGDAAAVARGAERFALFCVACHAADGNGRGPVVERGMVPPPSLLADHARALPDGQIFHILACGQGNMASYASQLAADDRWKLVLHVRALQGTPK